MRPRLTLQMVSDAIWTSIDNSDSRIRYDEDWYSDSSEASFWRVTSESRHSGRSLHWTNRTASLAFNFTGTGVKVHGGASSRSPNYWECFVDDKRLDFPTKTSRVEGNHNQLCHWMGAGAGAHVLTLKVTRLPPGQRLWVDRIQYLASSDPPAAGIESPNAMVVDDHLEAVLLLEPRHESSGEGVPPVLIVVGVLGGLAVVGTLVIFYWLRKRQKQREAALELKERGVLLGLRGMSFSDMDNHPATPSRPSAVHSITPLQADYQTPQLPPGLSLEESSPRP
ncbi:hypothetical protein EST38_g7950 [Candolleomyces aberdarensis]|uniref:Uncharacterized protein n=1 Tax=Candolleomyces aberdarensis TaxID=2316362 RepID=A0A4Q2DFM9_9AGAR|nr:hypothetical protein EST38_g7950 [Candolleomyces aberdarensis]